MNEQTDTTASAIAGQLTTSEREALGDILDNKAVKTSMFWSLYDKGLTRDFSDGRGVTRLGALVFAAIEGNPPAEDARPVTITAADFVRDGYAAKISNRECVVMRNKDEQIISIRLSSFGGYPIEVIKPFDANIYESCTVDEAIYKVTWLHPPASEPPAGDVNGGAVRQQVIDDAERLGLPAEAVDAWDEWHSRSLRHEESLDALRNFLKKSGEGQDLIGKLNLLKSELSDLLSADSVRDATYNDIWDIVRPDPETWDYPPQITRYVQFQAEELVTLRAQNAALVSEVAAVRGALKPLRASWVNWLNSTMTGIGGKKLDFHQWFWLSKEAEKAEKHYKGAFDALESETVK